MSDDIFNELSVAQREIVRRLMLATRCEAKVDLYQGMLELFGEAAKELKMSGLNEGILASVNIADKRLQTVQFPFLLSATADELFTVIYGNHTERALRLAEGKGNYLDKMLLKESIALSGWAASAIGHGNIIVVINEANRKYRQIQTSLLKSLAT